MQRIAFAVALTLNIGIASAQTTAPAAISPDAKAQLAKLSAAYSQLTALELVGKLTANIDIAGEKTNKTADFTASFIAPNKFRQEMKQDVLAGSTGDKLYLYSKEHNLYEQQDAPKAKFEAGAVPAPYDTLLGGQNPSLLLALSADPAAALTKEYPSVDKLPDTKLADQTFPTLRLTNPDRKDTITLLIDPTTNLIRRAVVNMSKTAEQRGATDVKAAEITIDYTTTDPGAPAKPEQFAWAPPAGAKDAAQAASNDEPAPADVLVGKPAPDFKLKTLEDKEVTLAANKGKVVILDFWASWCGPCREGLPRVDKIYSDLKDQGVVAYAVNLRETKKEAKATWDDLKLSLPAIMDTDGKVGELYKVEGIPQTVIIGRDGKVKKVSVGVGPNTATELRAAVEAALKG